MNQVCDGWCCVSGGFREVDEPGGSAGGVLGEVVEEVEHEVVADVIAGVGVGAGGDVLLEDGGGDFVDGEGGEVGGGGGREDGDFGGAVGGDAEVEGDAFDVDVGALAERPRERTAMGFSVAMVWRARSRSGPNWTGRMREWIGVSAMRVLWRDWAMSWEGFSGWSLTGGKAVRRRVGMGYVYPFCVVKYTAVVTLNRWWTNMSG